MTQSFPGQNHLKRLDEAAQCIANALEREVKAQLRQIREPTSTQTVSSLLSDTVIQDLDETLAVDINETTDIQHHHQANDYNDVVVSNGDNNVEEKNDDDQTVDNDSDVSVLETLTAGTEDNESIQQLDNSITVLKQIAVAADKSKTNNGNSKNTFKCCDSCKVKSKSKTKYEMTRCSACMTWFHDKCVGIGKDEPIGFWLCLICREIPSNIQHEITCVKDEVKELKNTTDLILSAVSKLAKSMENLIGGINDRLTSLSKQVKTNDKKTLESIESVATETQNVKELLEQKSGQILNKSTSILDKVKSYTGTAVVNKSPLNDIQKKPADSNQPTNRKAADEKSNNKQPTAKAQTSKTQKTTPSSSHDQIQQEESIDLTESDHNEDFTEVKRVKIIKQSTLLIGSALLKNVKVGDLNKSTAVRTFPRATIDTIKSKLTEYNLDNCKTIILLVGGNDAENGTDLETFAEKYELLLNSLLADDHRVVVAGLLPRETVDLSAFNNRLRQLCDACDVEFVENYQNFLLASGEIPESYYSRDKIHLNNYGTRKLLSNIDKVHRVAAQGQASVPDRSGRMYRPAYRANNGKSRPGNNNNNNNNRPSKFCHICMRNGHATQECWFNGRNEGWSMRQPR